uniref:NTF2-related export protein n=1 Tax=Octopus bimaculoides TaxID=37653 RepID=A0A0L8FSK0_OCTBM
MIIGLWFRFLNRAMLCVLEQNTSFYILLSTQLAKVNNLVMDWCPIQLLSKLYMTNAQMVWNGTFVEGMTEIMKFIEHLPSTETSVETFDCHPLADVVSQGQTTIGVTTFGLVKFPRKKSKAFHQHFILTSQENVWKIVSDNYRFVE